MVRYTIPTDKDQYVISTDAVVQILSKDVCAQKDQLHELMALLKLTIGHVRWAVFVMFFMMLFKVLLEAGDIVWYLGIVDGSICLSLFAIFVYLSVLEDRL